METLRGCFAFPCYRTKANRCWHSECPLNSLRHSISRPSNQDHFGIEEKKLIYIYYTVIIRNVSTIQSLFWKNNMRMSIYLYTFKSVILESVKIKTFSKSVKIESVRVDRHPQYSIKHITNLENIVGNTWGDIWR